MTYKEFEQIIDEFKRVIIASGLKAADVSRRVNFAINYLLALPKILSEVTLASFVLDVKNEELIGKAEMEDVIASDIENKPIHPLIRALVLRLIDIIQPALSN